MNVAEKAADTTSAELLVDRTAPGFAGDVEPRRSYEFLRSVPEAMLVDVRTLPEWQFTGTPDLRDMRKETVCASWKTYPQFTLNPNFVAEISQCIPDKNTPIFFLCRSGGRSTDAAISMTTAGYRYCFNILGGFEGEPDSNGQRGRKSGWKSAGLPWSQT